MSSEKGTLLIADDEPEIIEILAQAMARVAGDIKVAGSGKEALALLEGGGIDAVLTDINMPVMDGLELLAETRARGSEVPFVFLTAFGDKENTREALRLGATDFLDKPFDPRAVAEVMAGALELGVAIREAERETGALYRSAGLEGKRSRLRELRASIAARRRASASHATHPGPGRK